MEGRKAKRSSLCLKNSVKRRKMLAWVKSYRIRLIKGFDERPTLYPVGAERH